MSAWLASLRRAGAEVTVLDTVPTFGIRRKGAFLFALWAIYFLPGTLFRLSRFPGFEMLVKLSPILAWRLLRRLVRGRPELVVFSHHSSFLYSLFVARHRRVFIIQDLLYVRARSMGYPKALCKLLFKVECKVYGLAEHLVSLSHDELRILERFLGPRISLASCLDREEVVAGLPATPDRRIALVSDWRRPENLHGLLTFFAPDRDAGGSGERHEFVLYGFDSAAATRKVAAAAPHTGHAFTDGGTYATFTDIQQVFFLVPIYLGAGIKRKTLETLQSGRYVLGTPAAFIGLRPGFLKDRALTVASPRDIVLPDSVPLDIGEAFRKYYFQEFGDIGELLVGFLGPAAAGRRR
ncbi:MAG: hypothetical protein K8S21_07530 [Gemmatimonadetes bacterium]|nr:hypothetical protein [Gemmatimonadota bacterium]